MVFEESKSSVVEDSTAVVEDTSVVSEEEFGYDQFQSYLRILKEAGSGVTISKSNGASGRPMATLNVSEHRGMAFSLGTMRLMAGKSNHTPMLEQLQLLQQWLPRATVDGSCKAFVAKKQ